MMHPDAYFQLLLLLHRSVLCLGMRVTAEAHGHQASSVELEHLTTMQCCDGTEHILPFRWQLATSPCLHPLPAVFDNLNSMPEALHGADVTRVRQVCFAFMLCLLHAVSPSSLIQILCAPRLGPVPAHQHRSSAESSPATGQTLRK